MENQEYSAILIEDEGPQVEQMKRFLSSRPEIKLKDVAYDGEEAIKKIMKKSYDLIFLDLNLPKIPGSELIQKIEKNTYFIVITSRRDKAVDSLNLGAIDYLLKPVFQDRFNQAIDRFLVFASFQKNHKEKSITIHEARKSVIIQSKDVVYIEANQGFSIIHTDDKIYKTRKGLNDFIEELKDSGFIRIHKKFIINQKYISKLESMGNSKFSLSLKDQEDTELPVTRTFMEDLRKRI